MKVSLGAVFVILILVLANLWLVRLALSSPGNNLPRLELGALEAASIVLEKKAAPPTWSRPHTILILGRVGEGYVAPELTDTIMLLNIDPLANPPAVKLVSIPRDLLVKIADGSAAGTVARANALWPLERRSYSKNPLGQTKKIFEEITGVAVDSVVIFDLETARKIIERTDGVTVFVAEDIYDPRFPTKEGGYEIFTLAHGWRYLSAVEALRFARTRSSARGDFDRMARQQELLRSLKGRITSLNPFWDFGKLWSIFNILKKELVTDLDREDIRNLWAVGERVSFDKVETLALDEASAGLLPRRIILGGQAADVLVSSAENPFDYLRVRKAIAGFLQNN